MLLDKKPLTGQSGIYGSAAFDQNSNEVIVKLVNSSDKAQTVNVALESTKRLATKGKMVVLKSDNLDQVNSLEFPMLVSPFEQEVIIKGKKLNQVLAPYSFTVIRIRQMQ